MDISSPSGGWSHTIGWVGETNGASRGDEALRWATCPIGSEANALSWRKTEFTVDWPGDTAGERAVAEDDFSVLLDASGMRRGHYYLNGHEYVFFPQLI